jgi:hypothetical protein
MSQRFEAVLADLRAQLDHMRRYIDLPGFPPTIVEKWILWIPEYDAAIHLLEAADNAENKSLMKLALDLGITFSAAMVVHDRGYKDGERDAIIALPDEKVAGVVGQEPDQDVFFPVGHGPNEPGRKNDGE